MFLYIISHLILAFYVLFVKSQTGINNNNNNDNNNIKQTFIKHYIFKALFLYEHKHRGRVSNLH